jgi:uncharacterized SAM-binding protein YcdF (DUF218 family)
VKRVRSGLVAVLVLAALLWLAGFLWFVHGLTNPAARGTAPADGIVVLTGGADRIATGLLLVRAHRGRRLLISGVNPETTAADIARYAGFAEQFACCIDIGYRASDTQGNASEAARWAARRGYRSLIIVTSASHMPRGLAEMRRAMPDTRLVPYPVIPGGVGAKNWWRHPATAWLLAREYSKYLVSLARLYLGVPLPGM